MMYDSYQASVIEELDNYIKSFPGVKDYHMSMIPDNSSLISRYNGKILLRLWVKEDIFDSYEVMEVLSNNKTFKDNVIEKAKQIRYAVVFDIYKS